MKAFSSFELLVKVMLLSLGVLAVFNPMKVLANNTTHENQYCTGVWSGYVDAARVGLGQLEERAVLLFVGAGGVVYDCLNAELPSDQFEAIAFWQRAWSLTVNDLEDELIRNSCDLAVSDTQNPWVFTLHLSIDMQVLASDRCSNRLANLQRDMKNLLER